MNKHNEIETIQNNLTAIAEVIEKVLLYSDRNKILESAEAIANVLARLPKEAKDTRIFKTVVRFEKAELNYENIKVFLEECLLECSNDDWEMFLQCDKDESKLYSYVKKVIQDKYLKKREKVIILLAHMEELILDTIQYSRQPNEKLKVVVEDVAIKNNHGISLWGIASLYVLGVTYILFSNTDTYKNAIDKRIPFRNNILHRGSMSYDEEDFETQYDILLVFIRILRYVRNKY